MSDVNDETTALLRAARAAKPSDAARSRMRAGLAAKIAVGVGAGAAVTALGSTAKAAGAAEGSAKAALATKAATAASAATATAKGAVVATGVIATAKAALVGMILGGVVIGTATVLPAKLSFSTPAPTATATNKFADPAPIAPKHEAVTSAPASEASAVVEAPPADAPAPPDNTSSGTSANEAQRANGERAQGDGAKAQLKANDAANVAPPMSSAPAEEVAELQSAERLLNSGDPNRALAELEKMKASHPNGAMREERLAAEVIADCKAGRTGEGREAKRAFLAEFPSSVHADRVRAACVTPVQASE